MKGLIAVLILAAGALTMSGCATTVGYGYDEWPGTTYYTYNRPYRSFEPYRYHHVRPYVAHHAVVHGEIHARDY